MSQKKLFIWSLLAWLPVIFLFLKYASFFEDLGLGALTIIPAFIFLILPLFFLVLWAILWNTPIKRYAIVFLAGLIASPLLALILIVISAIMDK